MINWRQRLLASVSVLAVLMTVLPTSALAYTFPASGVAGRAEFHGYFENKKDSCGAHVIDGGLGYNPGNNTFVANYKAPQFIAEMHSLLFSGNDGQDRTGAAFIVLTMLGVKGTDPAINGSHNKGVAYAQSLWNEWTFQVNAYAAVPGKVEWAKFMSFPFDGTKTYLNSLYQGRDDCGGPKGPDTRNPNDDTFYSDDTPQSRPTIIFHNNDGSVYMIKRNCGNPIGPFSALKDGAFSYDPKLATAGATPPPGSIVEAGTTISLTASFRNSGPSAGPVAGALGYYPSYAGVASPEVALGSYGPVGSGLSSPGFPFSFTVSTSVPEGTQLCVRSRVKPHTSITPPNTADSAALCWLVYKPHYPGIIGKSGDVHAGGGLCGQAQTSGSITAHPSSKSLTEYVLSASGIVSNFGSNNTAGGSGATLGKTGNYSTVCRADLLAVANAYINSAGPSGYTMLGGSDYDINSLPPSTAGVYVHNTNAPLKLHGTYTKSQAITIVELGTGGATVQIPTSLMQNAPATTGDSVPSIGIISTNDIRISGAATRVDAYLFSNSGIDTCVEGNTAACRNTLTVNGFLMGRSILFHRLGPTTGATATVGEQVNLTGQLYLNPPKLFDSASVVNLLQHQGERDPLN